MSDCQRTHPVTLWDEITTPQLRRPASQGPDSIKATRLTQTHIHVFNNKQTFHKGLHTQWVYKSLMRPMNAHNTRKTFQTLTAQTAESDMHTSGRVALKIGMNRQSDTRLTGFSLSSVSQDIIKCATKQPELLVKGQSITAAVSSFFSLSSKITITVLFIHCKKCPPIETWKLKFSCWLNFFFFNNWLGCISNFNLNYIKLT